MATIISSRLIDKLDTKKALKINTNENIIIPLKISIFLLVKVFSKESNIRLPLIYVKCF
jgi:hypothetical protein